MQEAKESTDYVVVYSHIYCVYKKLSKLEVESPTHVQNPSKQTTYIWKES